MNFFETNRYFNIPDIIFYSHVGGWNPDAQRSTTLHLTRTWTAPGTEPATMAEGGHVRSSMGDRGRMRAASSVGRAGAPQREPGIMPARPG